MPDHRAVLVLADFNAANLASYLANDASAPLVRVQVAPMMRGVGLAAGHVDAAALDTVVLWTQPQHISHAFARLLAGDEVDPAGALDEVDAWASALEALAARARTVLLPSWVMPHAHRGFGLLGMRDHLGPVNLLMRMTLRLADRLAPHDNIFILDSQPWMQEAGGDAYNARLWHLAKVPFGNAVFKAAARAVKAAISAVAGESRRLVIVDLDNTLWGGVLGDEGWQGLRLGGHDAQGEAHVEFQRELQCLTKRGVILGIVSKNDEGPALAAIDRHPEMVLRAADFAGWRINWEDKAHNVTALTAELNLGLRSVVFIDDNPIERDRVRQALPEVLVPDWPANPLLYPNALARLDCFDLPAITLEDRGRQRAYRARAARQRTRDTAPSLDRWLSGLGITVRVEELSDANLLRVAQLLNKTNQMNLTTRRLAAAELRSWASLPQHKLWAFRVSDKFEDAGLTGLLSLALAGQDARIVDFVLSCRVIGREVEDAMLWHAVDYARGRGMARLLAEYVPTDRNSPCLRFFERSGFERLDHGLFGWNVGVPFGAPRHVTVQTLVER